MGPGTRPSGTGGKFSVPFFWEKAWAANLYRRGVQTILSVRRYGVECLDFFFAIIDTFFLSVLSLRVTKWTKIFVFHSYSCIPCKCFIRVLNIYKLPSTKAVL